MVDKYMQAVIDNEELMWLENQCDQATKYVEVTIPVIENLAKQLNECYDAVWDMLRSRDGGFNRDEYDIQMAKGKRLAQVLLEAY